jgi:hypothetical protein
MSRSKCSVVGRKFGFLLLLFGFHFLELQAQFVITSKSGANFEKGYYHAPLKVIVKGMWKADQKAKQDYIDKLKNFGFTDTILLFTPPQYPTTRYRDSIDAICKQYKVQSVMEISFSTFSNSYAWIDLPAQTTIRMDYRAYDFEKGVGVLPNILFGGGSLEAIKEKFNKAIPDIN